MPSQRGLPGGNVRKPRKYISHRLSESDGKNTAGMRFFEIEKISVAPWHELPDAQGPATQLHLLIELKGTSMPLILRIKSADAADAIIEALTLERSCVWPAQ